MTCSEWNESDVLDEGKVKMLTGGFVISVRKLFAAIAIDLVTV